MTYWHNDNLYIELYNSLYSVFVDKTGKFIIEVYFGGEWLPVEDTELRKELKTIYNREVNNEHK